VYTSTCGEVKGLERTWPQPVCPPLALPLPWCLPPSCLVCAFLYWCPHRGCGCGCGCVGVGVWGVQVGLVGWRGWGEVHVFGSTARWLRLAFSTLPSSTGKASTVPGSQLNCACAGTNRCPIGSGVGAREARAGEGPLRGIPLPPAQPNSAKKGLCGPCLISPRCLRPTVRQAQFQIPSSAVRAPVPLGA